jgi:hypothetical protein
MHPTLRDRILRHLEPLPDERAYQVLDYIEFLEKKYGTGDASSANLFQRFTEGVEDTLRAGKVSTTAIGETMGLLSKAMGVLSGVAAAGKSVASDIVDVASRTVSGATSTGNADPRGRVTGPEGSGPAAPSPGPVSGHPEPPVPPTTGSSR